MFGLASTVFLPLTGWSVQQLGWRHTQRLCAIAVLVTAFTMERWVLPALPASQSLIIENTASIDSRRSSRFVQLAAVFGLGTLASTGVTTQLIPLLIDRGQSPAIAAIALAALGTIQLPGRIWLLRGNRPLPTSVLTIAPLWTQATGLAIIAMSSSLWLVAAGVALFGVDAGLQTLAKPWLIQRLYGASRSGYWNGQLA